MNKENVVVENDDTDATRRVENVVKVATFIADEVTTAASIARQTFRKDAKKPGSVTDHKLRKVLDGVLKDYTLLNGVTQVN